MLIAKTVSLSTDPEEGYGGDQNLRERSTRIIANLGDVALGSQLLLG